MCVALALAMLGETAWASELATAAAEDLPTEGLTTADAAPANPRSPRARLAS
jgi:hypothetical protein